MGDRFRRNAGRGHSTEVWTHYHNRIANLPNKGSRAARHEKVVKLTEILRKKENFTDQTELTMEFSNDEEVLKSLTADSEMEYQETDLSEKDLHEHRQKSSEFGQSTTRTGTVKGNTKIESTRDNESTKKNDTVNLDKTMTGHNGQVQEATNTPNEHWKEQDIKHRPTTEHNEEKMDEAMEIVSVWDYDEKQKHGIRQTQTLEQAKLNEKTSTRINGSNYITSVQIKKELVDEAAEMWDAEDSQNEEDNKSTSSIDTATIMASIENSEEGSETEDTEDEMPGTQWQTQEKTNLSVSKRKSVPVEHSQIQKRLHIMPQEQSSYKPIQNNRLMSKRDYTNSKYKENVQETSTNNTEPRESTNVVDSTVIEDPHNESDTEWEMIRRNNERILKNNHPPKEQNGYGQRKHKGRVTITTRKSDPLQKQTIHSRGMHMLDEAKRITTPVSIEYNLENTVVEFNVLEELETIFKKMNQADVSVRVLDTNTQEELWTAQVQLPEGPEFEKNFNLREQTFRKGNKKVTVYCTIESTITVNRLKYLEPLKSHIMESNIWVKTDWYSTKVVNSPGFFTLLHPKITNKGEMIKEIEHAIQQTVIDKEEPAVQEWQSHNPEYKANEGTGVPKFHLETNNKKWGGLQCEVLSVHCTKEDARYLKYILAEASTQKKLAKGVFVPTGIHLMEGKDILTQILQEHQDFLQQVTSIQIGGITYEEMTRSAPQKEPLITRFLQCEGVYALEPTYHTANTGQWLLVVKKKRIETIKKYISNTQAEIYKGRGGKSSPEFRYKESPNTQGYKLVVVDRWTSRVGTYAEALRNRFQSGKPTTQIMGPSTVMDSETSSGKVQGHAHLNKEQELNARQSKQSRQYSAVHGRAEDSVLGNSVTTMELGADETTDSDLNALDQHGIEGEEYRTTSKQAIQETTNHEKAMKEMEAIFEKKITEMNNHNNEFIESVERKINKRVEDIMESKLNKMSQMVSDMVTARLLKGMTTMMHRKAAKENQDEGVKVTKVSQTSQSPSTPPDINNIRQKKPIISGTRSFSTTELMVQELSNIENSTPPRTDPPHDVTKIGSSVTEE